MSSTNTSSNLSAENNDSDRSLWSRIDYATLACALFGSLIASMADLNLKGTASAIVTMQTTLAPIVNGAPPALVPLALLVIVAIGLCFVYQPGSRQTAFALGLSAVSVVTTATPIKLPDSPPARVGAPVHSAIPGVVVAANGWFIPEAAAQAPQPTLRLSFKLTPAGPGSSPTGAITVRAREIPDGRVFEWRTDQFAKQARFPLQFAYDLPLTRPRSTVDVRVEFDNYQSVTQQLKIESAANQTAQLDLTIEKSALPSVIKNLIQQRAF